LQRLVGLEVRVDDHSISHQDESADTADNDLGIAPLLALNATNAPSRIPVAKFWIAARSKSIVMDASRDTPYGGRSSGATHLISHISDPP
jgi:hypothetical protein